MLQFCRPVKLRHKALEIYVGAPRLETQATHELIVWRVHTVYAIHARKTPLHLHRHISQQQGMQ